MTPKSVGKILVVDDEIELKNILVEALVSQGYEAVGFTCGEEALEALQSQAFDVLLTDLMMPGIDGIALVREAIRIDPNMIFLMMTGQGTIQTAVDAMKVGAFDYVLKPFRLRTMLPVLTRAMNMRHVRLENVQLREAVAIHELSETIAFTLDQQTVLSKLAEGALSQSEADEVSILLPTGDGKELYVAAVRGENRQRLLGERVPYEQSISSWVAREREPVILNGEVNDDRFVARWPRAEIRSAISIPMQVANRLVGIINLNLTNRFRPFTLGQMKALTILAGTAAAALESASLYTQMRQAEANYRSIFENSIEGIFQATHQGRYLNVNPAMARILGYDSPADMIESVTNINQQVFVSPERGAEVLGLIEKAGAAKDLEVEAYRKGGEKIWLSMNIRGLSNDSGTPYCEGTVEDITERKRAEAELSFQKTLLESQSEASIDGILVVSSDREILSYNQRFVELWGISEFVLGSRSDQTALQSVIDQVANPAKFLDGIEYLYNHPADNSHDELQLNDGRTFDRYSAPIKSNHDEYYGRVWFFRDITESKRAEAELRQSEERYRDLVENAHDIIYSHDLKGNYTSSNKAGEDITGYTLAESLQLNLRQTIAPEYLEKACEMLTRKLAGEKITAYELEMIAKDGHRVPIEVNTRLVLHDGVVMGVTGIARDITERKRAEAELRRLAAAVEETGDSVVITDQDGNIQYVNSAFERVTGYSREEVLNLNPRILKSGKTDPAVYKDLWETITRGDVWTGQLTNRRKDGTLFDERVTISAIYDQSHAIVNYVAVKQDISDLIRLEEQLRQSQKMEAIGQLAGGVAHDFNNLLTAINGYSSLALQRLEDDHPIKPYLEEVKKAGDRAANLTRQLLAFGRKQILQPLPINLNDVVTDMNKMLRRLIGEDVEFTAKLDPALKKITADPGQVEQVLVNLVVNARDAMPQGGDLTIETATVELDSTYTSKHVGFEHGRYVMLAVSDTGTGMDQTTQARIFDPFFTTKEKGKGTGLGLSTVYGIVKQSGGNILVYSELGHGTTFKVYLPQLMTPQATEPVVIETAALGGSETILLVEDEDVVRGLAQQILEQSGYRVLAAARGAEAVRLSQEQTRPIDLLLTDVVMPETSGKEVADRLRELVPGLRVVFMSGYTDEAIVHHGVLDSNVEFIQKPFTPAALIRKVREVLDSEMALTD